MGGMIAAIGKGFPQTEVANAAYNFQQQIDKREKIVVGVNKHITRRETPIELLKIDEKLQAEQINRLREVKRMRDNRKVVQTLTDLRHACQSDKNVMPYVIEAAKEHATEQEICDVYREVFGEYRDPGFY